MSKPSQQQFDDLMDRLQDDDDLNNLMLRKIELYKKELNIEYNELYYSIHIVDLEE